LTKPDAEDERNSSADEFLGAPPSACGGTHGEPGTEFAVVHECLRQLRVEVAGRERVDLQTEMGPVRAHSAGEILRPPLLAAYGAMPVVEYLSLNGNNLQGRIPPELGNLTTLRELYLGYYNVFDGGIPPALSALRSLTVLDVSNCGLTGRVPA